MSDSPVKSFFPFKKILALLSVVLICGVVVIGIFSTKMLYKPRLGGPNPFPHDLFANFQVKNGAGQIIQAWWATGSVDLGAVLLCHGHGVDHTDFAGMVPFLRAASLSLLLLDFRAHGQSEGKYTSIGLVEWDDLKCVIEESERRGFLASGTRLAAYGRSMGATTLINGAGHLPRIAAFVLESPFAELRLIAARDLKSVFRIPDNPLIDVVFKLAEWWTGIPYLQNRPVDAIHEIGSRPALLIHDELDGRATRPDHDRLVASLPGARTMVVPGAGHVGGHGRNPDVFERDFLGFLASASILTR